MRIFLRTRIHAVLFILAFFALITVDASATIRHVPADYPTIQQAIDAAVNGDTVLVAPGTYVENISFLGKAITVTSESGAQSTLIDGHRVDSVVRFTSQEGPSSVLNGFTITNGAAEFNSSLDGGGIRIVNSSPTIINNIITNNIACDAGAGIYALFSSPIIRDNIIADNKQSGCIGGPGGGGIAIGGASTAQILNNTISRNSFGYGGGISLNGTNALIIRGNKISANTASLGGGINILTFSSAIIVQNLITDNVADAGGGMYWFSGPGVIEGNTIANNNAPSGSAVYALTGTPQTMIVNNILVGKAGQTAVACGANDIKFNYSNIFSPQGAAFVGGCSGQEGINHNISADPFFVNPAAGDYHLQPNSPVIDKGDNSAPNLPATDLDGKPRIQDGNGDGVAIVDMGAYEAPAPFNLCIQDDSSGNLLQINTMTGAYQFSNCGGLTITGLGTLTSRGGIISFQHYASDRRVIARIDTSTGKATASLQQLSTGMTFSITDRNITNNTCSCNR